ncbi:hypothetical protein Q8A67_019110 [Cirrhinus molitorella]|uniref:Uncharacterized protein n=1 Tax=Cirrhinus molitorella TaxID=172907 RepID=A0AA88TDF4_9TELE|nr:hypothetical protein Q8A67_019110 [Cirrhinus molitorella]
MPHEEFKNGMKWKMRTNRDTHVIVLLRSIASRVSSKATDTLKVCPSRQLALSISISDEQPLASGKMLSKEGLFTNLLLAKYWTALARLNTDEFLHESL